MTQSFKLTNQDLLRKGIDSNQDAIACDTACTVPALSPPNPTHCSVPLSWLSLVGPVAHHCPTCPWSSHYP